MVSCLPVKTCGILPSRGLMLHCLQRGLNFSGRLGGGCLVHGILFSIMPGLSLLGTGTTPYLPQSWLSKMSPGIAKCPLRGQNYSWLRTSGIVKHSSSMTLFSSLGFLPLCLLLLFTLVCLFSSCWLLNVHTSLLNSTPIHPNDR